MRDEEFQRLLTGVEALSQVQLAAVDSAIKSRLGLAATHTAGTVEAPGEVRIPAEGNGSISDIEARFAAAPRCPHCRSAEFIKWGRANRLKRYRCKPCGVTFNALTGTPLSQLHKRDLWGGHAQALVEGLSLRKASISIWTPHSAGGIGS